VFILEGKDNLHMEIGIIGGGSVGLLISSYLCTAHDVTIYVKRIEQKQKINSKGLYVTKDSIALPVKALLVDEMEKEECLIFCVKQSQVATVLTKINKQSEDTPFVFLQNGMGHINQLEKLRNSVFIGVVEHGALRERDNVVRHTGKGVIKLATLHGGDLQLEMLVKQLTQSFFPVQIATNWRLLLSEKLVINAVINPLTTLFHVKNGAILYNPYINCIAKELCREAALILNLDFTE
jgi:2-dehydropantoate 2-reductase